MKERNLMHELWRICNTKDQDDVHIFNYQTRTCVRREARKEVT